MFTVHDSNVAEHIISYAIVGIMLWSICRRGPATMRRTPTLWACGWGYVMAWGTPALASMSLTQPMLQGVLLADYAGLVLGQLLVGIYLLLLARWSSRPLTPLSQMLSARRQGVQRPKLVLLSESNRSPALADEEAALTGDLGTDYLRLVA